MVASGFTVTEPVPSSVVAGISRPSLVLSVTAPHFQVFQLRTAPEVESSMTSEGVAVKVTMPGEGAVRRTALMAERVWEAPLPVMVIVPPVTGTYFSVSLLTPS